MQQPLKLVKKIRLNSESFEFFDVYSTKFKNYYILHNKISHRFLVPTKLFTGWKIPIILTCG